MKRLPRILFAMFFLAGLIQAEEVSSCSCYWMGPFMKMAPQSPLVIRGIILGYHGEERGIPLAMDVRVLEVLRGKTEQSQIRVWGGKGWLCRPEVTQFPVGTEWILALNGPGSKPGVDPGPAISVCGEFWLKVADGKVIGNIDNTVDQKASQEMALKEFRTKLANGGQADRARLKFSGQVSAGESFVRNFGPSFTFHLVPSRLGWEIAVKDERGTENITRLTPPFHSVPNPREIEGWHFRNADNSGPNEAGDRNVNAPGEEREFIFSPAVGRTIDGPGANRNPTPEEIEIIRSFGKGKLTILEYRLADLEPGKQARFEWVRFEVEVSWSKGSKAD